ncbi:cystathionine gamma-synthase [Gallaecimonas kandeliae]|uniref:cystathionine gamma-synthase n=1 Tax=Gallaecimonas kandeliae TaxID=3029055 RepID=UPI002648DB40|nr:cystathionine gamma-synthase [Gallaecimonas kandeliae]WKE65327.1 cystathionine gamma-synthase [Gallaecimonas kandeliae]
MSIQQSTSAVRAGIDTDHQFNAVVPPLYLSSNYRFHDIHTPAQYDYSRSGNPTRDLLGQAIAELEGGARGVITATGMGAVTLALQLLSPGEVLVVPHDCYGGSWRLFNALAKKGAFELLTVDQGDAQALAAALAKKPRLVWVETPSNPLLRVVDVQAICEQAHAVGSLVLVDNTFLSPLGQQPLALGADLVLHSTTKYLNGHSDVVGGALVAKEQALGDELAWWANCIGITGAPFDAFLTLRGLRTLAARYRAHEENAQALVAWLDAQPEVKVINYPGLKSHPNHDLAKRQQKSFGAMFSVEFAAPVEALGRFVSRLRLFSLAESLGGVESLVAVPATMTHAAMSPEARAAAGINDGLLRFSVGIEGAEDLIADLAQAWPALRGE